MLNARRVETTEEPSNHQSELVLVVDDSRAQRRLLCSYLTGWGYRVLEAGSGAEALEICRFDNPDLIVSDWMMPGMNGLEFCQKFRELRGDRYGYFILLTSKSEKGEVARGLDIGADDFLTKPVNSTELRARIRAGERVLKNERELTEKNRLISVALAEKQLLYDAIDRDLIEARKLQQSLVRDRFIQFKGADVSMMLHPAGHVGGDLVGAFAVTEEEIGIYSIDVSGHGIASALMTARLAGYFNGNSPKQNIAISRGTDGTPVMRSPGKVVETLNMLILNEMDTEHYLTILLAKINLSSGKVTMTQAGHPYPAIQKPDGSVTFHGDGGLPVGLIPDAKFSEFELHLQAGERLFLASDGITECTNITDQMLEEEGLKKILQQNSGLSGERFFETLMWDLNAFNGDVDFDDDVSGVLVEFTGPNKNTQA